MSDENRTQGNSEWLKTYGLALVDRVPCDTVKCDKDATMYAQVKCCGAVVINCRSCMMNAYRALNWMMRVGETVLCHQCHTRNDPRNWLSLPKKLVESEVDNDDSL